MGDDAGKGSVGMSGEEQEMTSENKKQQKMEKD